MTIFRSSLLVSITSLIVSVISFLSQLIIAYYFGARAIMDVYIYASSFPLLISALFTSSFNYMAVPFIIKIQNEINSKIILAGLIKKILKISFILNLTLSLISVYFLFYIRKEVNSEIILINTLTWITSFFAILSSLFYNILNANNKFIQSLFISIIPYFGMIIFISLLQSFTGSVSISLGLMIGTFISLIVSGISIRNYVILSFGKINNFTLEIRYFINKIPIVAISMLCFTIFQFIDSFWAPKLGPSTLSYLSYSQKIIVAVGSIIIVAPSTVLVPRLTTASNQSRQIDYLKDVIVVLKVILCLSLFFACLLGALSEKLIKVMFERGSFTSVDTIEVASLMPYMLFGMVFMLCVVFIIKANFASGFNRTTMFIGILTSFLYFFFSGLGSTFLGIKGIAIGYIMTWFIILILSLLNTFKGNYSALFNKDIGTDIFKILELNFLVLISVLATKEYLYRLFSNSYYLSDVILIGIIAILNCLLFFVLAIYVVKQKDMIFLLNKIWS